MNFVAKLDPLAPIKPLVAFKKISGCLSRRRSLILLNYIWVVMNGHKNFVGTRGGHELFRVGGHCYC